MCLVAVPKKSPRTSIQCFILPILMGCLQSFSIDLKPFTLVGWDRSSFVCCLAQRYSTDDMLLLQISSCVVWQTRDLHLSRNMLYMYLLSPRLGFFIVLKRGFFVDRDDSLTSKRVIMRTEQPTKCFIPLQKLKVRLRT